MIPFNRRHALAAGAAVLASPALASRTIRPAAAQSAAGQSAASGQAPGFYRYKVGDITVTAVNDGFFTRPLEGLVRNAELPAVQAAVSAAFLPLGGLPIPFTSLVVETGGRLILLDTGNGNTGAPTSGAWMANFRAAGFDPARVDAVIISHFHGDHINGIRLRDGTAVFPNAEIQVPAPEWTFWMSDERMNAAPEAMRGAFANCRRIFGPVAADVKRFEPGAEVASGITSIAAYGHTPGHTAFAIASGNARMIYMADVTNHPALFVRNPDWMAVFDMDGETARLTRRRMLDMAATEKTRVHFYHAPFPANGYIAKDGNGFQLVPAQWSSAV